MQATPDGVGVEDDLPRSQATEGRRRDRVDVLARHVDGAIYGGVPAERRYGVEPRAEDLARRTTVATVAVVQFDGYRARCDDERRATEDDDDDNDDH